MNQWIEIRTESDLPDDSTWDVAFMTNGRINLGRFIKSRHYGAEFYTRTGDSFTKWDKVERYMIIGYKESEA